MMNNNTHILIFCKSDIILNGLFNVINETGFEPILLKNAEDFLNYPHLLGYVLIILPPDLHEENYRMIEKHFAAATLVKYLFISNESANDSEIHIEDSTAIIQIKIQNEINSFAKFKQSLQSPALTNRELDVLKLVALGNTNKAIANNLFISTHTVISHRKNISEKIGIKTISGLTMYAVIKQIIDIKDINTENLK